MARLVFLGTGPSPSLLPNVKLDPVGFFASFFGSAIAGGDFDGDGWGDMAVGAPGALTLTEGWVWVYRGLPIAECPGP